MANTWQGPSTSWLPSSFSATVSDDLPYRLERNAGTFTYSLDGPTGLNLKLPVAILLGGRRHGLGFLVSVQQIDGLPLARPAMLQARYAWSPEKKKLLLAPGCIPTTPKSLEPALGLVLSPTFASRCLECHGKPNSLGAGKSGGVHCESCHGPGSAHLTAIARGQPQQGIINPKRLSTEASIGVCARCHVGLTRFSDPSPDDLLIANQVRAIKSSECFLQSRAAFSCITCHDPHGDAAADTQRSINACLSCHALGSKLRAAIRPVNGTANCITCHMPAVERDPLRLVDHLIRVHPEQSIKMFNHSPELRTHVQPVSEYLRLISTNTAEAAVNARQRLSRGESFYQVARDTSVDRTAAIGGFLGRRTLAELSGELTSQASRLAYAETSPVFENDSHWIILQRLPRDFRWDAEQLQKQAEDLALHGNAAGAIEQAQKALMIYPQFLRAINFIGVTFAQSGNPRKAAEVLATAEHLYPDDAKTEFALASVLHLMGDRAGASKAYRRVIAIESDFTAAYANLGMMSYSLGDWESAIKLFRQGLAIDPLSAELYYDLGLALKQSGDTASSDNATALARKLNPAFVESEATTR